MSWTNFRRGNVSTRLTDFNNNIVLRPDSVDNITSHFDTLWDNFTNFIDTIASLQFYPINMLVDEPSTDTHHVNTSKGTLLGAKAKPFDPRNTFRTLGEYFVSPKYNNFADYKGYTRIQVFLPFLGFVDVDPNECMGKYLQFRLVIDFFTGKGLYIIGVSDGSISHELGSFVLENEDNSMRVISTFECDIGTEIPLGSSNIGDIKRNMLLGTIKTVAAVAATIYTNGLAAPAVASETVSTVDYKYRDENTGRLRTEMRTTEKKSTVKTTSKEVNNIKPVSEAIDGSIDVLNRNFSGGNTDRVNDAGLLTAMSPRVQVLIYRPRMVPTTDDYDFLFGKPVGRPVKLNEIAGYTEISNIHIEGDAFNSATSAELAEIQAILLSPNGVILPGNIEKLSAFTINANKYNFKVGYTWEQFVSSSFNINTEFEIRLERVLHLPSGLYLKDAIGNFVDSASNIENTTYYL